MNGFQFRQDQSGIGDTKREEHGFLILSSLSHVGVVERSGVSSGTVSLIRGEIREVIPPYRNRSRDPACLLRASPPKVQVAAAGNPLKTLVGPAGLEPATRPL